MIPTCPVDLETQLHLVPLDYQAVPDSLALLGLLVDPLTPVTLADLVLPGDQLVLVDLGTLAALEIQGFRLDPSHPVHLGDLVAHLYRDSHLVQEIQAFHSDLGHPARLGYQVSHLLQVFRANLGSLVARVTQVDPLLHDFLLHLLDLAVLLILVVLVAHLVHGNLYNYYNINNINLKIILTIMK